MGLFTETTINIFPSMGLYTGGGGGGGGLYMGKVSNGKNDGLIHGGGGLIFGGLLNGPTDQGSYQYILHH